jgi:hypothetical protein
MNIAMETNKHNYDTNNSRGSTICSFYTANAKLASQQTFSASYINPPTILTMHFLMIILLSSFYLLVIFQVDILHNKFPTKMPYVFPVALISAVMLSPL